MVHFALNLLIDDEPITYEGALNSVDKCEWEKSMQDKIDSLNKFKTWILMDKPKSKKVVIKV